MHGAVPHRGVQGLKESVLPELVEAGRDDQVREAGSRVLYMYMT